MATLLSEDRTTIGATDEAVLCVDLDDTLLSTDTLYECLAVVMRTWRVVLVPIWLLRGIAHLKENLARYGAPAIDVLPANDAVLEYVQAEVKRGRKAVLVTAADSHIAERVSKRFGIFDEVLASDGVVNLKGKQKQVRLISRYGSRGYSYVGDSASDLSVWEHAREALIVNASPKLARNARAHCPTTILSPARPTGRAAAFLRALRPHQWSKNFLLFMPMLAAGAYSQTAAWAAALIGFVAFSAAASAIYLVNDLLDLESDRRHARKRLRPLAAGTLPLKWAFLTVPVLIAAAVILGIIAGIVWIVLAYAMCSVLYSLWFKRRQLVDVFTLSLLYSIRLFAGGEATDHAVSSWLLAFTTFLFLALALVKRVGELIALHADHRSLHGREYSRGDVPILTAMGVASSFTAALVFSLYINDTAVANHYSAPWLLWGNVPILLFWQCRIWLSTTRGYMHDDPIVYSVRDWVSWLAGAAFLVIHAAALTL